MYFRADLMAFALPMARGRQLPGLGEPYPLSAHPGLLKSLSGGMNWRI
jgi:hypothetical protein